MSTHKLVNLQTFCFLSIYSLYYVYCLVCSFVWKWWSITAKLHIKKSEAVYLPSERRWNRRYRENVGKFYLIYFSKGCLQSLSKDKNKKSVQVTAYFYLYFVNVKSTSYYFFNLFHNESSQWLKIGSLVCFKDFYVACCHFSYMFIMKANLAFFTGLEICTEIKLKRCKFFTLPKLFTLSPCQSI